MKTPQTYRRYIRYAIIFAAIFIGVYLLGRRKEVVRQPRDFSAIKASGVIHVATEYNKLSFYVDSDTVAGFNYQLIEAFAHDMGLRPDIHLVMSEKERLNGLNNGTYDLVACNLQTTSILKDSLLLTSPIILTRQVLVQRKKGTEKAPYINSQLDLAKKTLNVPQDSPSILRIRNLSNEIGDTIYVHEIKKYGSEQLMYMVAHGDIDYAVCDENIARTYAKNLPEIDIHTAISFTQFYSWGTNKKSPVLCNKLNAWLAKYRKTDGYKRMYQKYIDNYRNHN
jgi:membrane-bound lytic murein transglycosylase MltF